MKKRILSLCLALALCVGMLPVTAFAASGDFDIENGVLRRYNGPGGDVVIPSTVTEIGPSAFYASTYNGNTITSVTIPSSVTTIRDSAFQGQNELTEIYIPDSVKYIEYYAFQNCPKLKTVRLPKHLDYLGSYCFGECVELTDVTLPNTVGTMERCVFDNTPWVREQGEFAIVDGTLYAYNGHGSNVVVPSGVTKIACQFEEAFAKSSSITSITIPEGVTEICGSAFMSCVSLKSISLPSTLKKLGDSAFWGCTSLESVVLPDGLTSIEPDTFWGCSALKDVTIPASVDTVGYRAFVLDTGYNSDIGHYSGIPLTGITIHGAEGTVAEKIANDMGYVFAADQPSTSATPREGIASPNTQTITVLYYYYDEARGVDVCDERKVTFHCYALTDENGGETNYVKLRDVAYAISGANRQFNVGWDNATQSITLLNGDEYAPVGGEMQQTFVGEQPYHKSTAKVLHDYVPMVLDGITLTDENGGESNYFKLRDLGKTIGFDVSWYSDKGIVIDTWTLYNDVY